MGEDKKWIQKAEKTMRKDKPCTGDKFGSETCPPGSKRYNLAKTFRKMAKEEHQSSFDEAKVDTVKYGTLSSPAKEKARNERKFGKVGWNQGGQSQLRKGAHWDKRGEKKIKGQKPAPKGAYGEETVLELNRYGKETGKATGSLNKRPGTTVRTGGDAPGALRNVRSMIRKETGRPEGQKRRDHDARHSAQNRPESPKSTILKRRQQKARADAAMRDTRGT